jgi:hypothetical protein
MKTLLALVAVGAVIAAPAFAQPASIARNHERAPQQGWSSRVHVYAPNHYAPYYDSYGNGNGNLNPDFQLDGSY